MNAPVSVKRIGNVDELDALGPVWNELQDQCDYQHVLMDHRWVSTWWRHFGRGKAQHTLLLSSGRNPVGVVPLAITRSFEAFPFRDPYVMGPDDYQFLPGLRRRRLVPLRRLTFPLNLVSGNIRGQAIFPHAEPASYAAFAHYAAGIAGDWDVATLPGMRPWDQEQAVLANAARGAGLLPGRRQAKRPMLYIDLPASLEDFLRSRSSHFRQRMQQEANKLERTFAALGPMKVTCYRGAEIEEGLRRLFALEKQSWKVADSKQRRLHLSLDDHARGFFREAAGRFAADDNAQVLILSFGETNAAGWFTLERKGVASSVLTYRNEQLAEPVSIVPIWQELIKGGINRGLRRLDINGYTRNYLKWAKDQHDYSSMTLFNTAPYSRLLQFVDNGALAFARRFVPRSQDIRSEPARPST